MTGLRRSGQKSGPSLAMGGGILPVSPAAAVQAIAESVTGSTLLNPRWRAPINVT
jgi:hypothetical protein